ncbi:BREX-1 system adenine-specific DNA-methyltransferase PglX [Psychrobacter sp. JCM 18900]|uniref:BREX-1 system adenine-specific DNA-methyltransferase PglX n=1 Tax=Psychrobacter sp. JCM 18900 TaxID=1298608 RepID=UPI0004BAD2CE|nr:BREX-1 system adenine-specific DNA-methyltransferase PglX [Psychrobacter sp. JCM 18900]
MNGRLKAWSKKEYPNSKSDLFSMFVERCLGIVLDKGELGFITPFLWMFIGSFEAFREDLLSNCHITSLVQLEYNSFGPACVPVCTFTVHKKPSMTYEGRFIKLTDFKGENIQAPKVLEAIDQTDVDWSYKASTTDFLGLPSKPIAFWISDNIKKIFKNGVPFSKFMKPRQGLATADNDRFLRRWHEVEMRKTPLATYSGIDKWFPHSKGGTFRRWYGNNEWLVNWENSGSELKAFDKSVIRNEVDYLKGGFSWSDLTSSYFNSRHIPEGFVFDTAGPTAIQMQGVNAKNIFAFSNSKVFQELVNVSLQGMHYSNGVIGNTPIKKGVTSLQTDELALVDISKGDWDSYETSWEFKTSPLLKDEHRKSALKDTYIELRAHWQQMTYDMQRLEEENNRIFIDAYGLQDELTPEVPLKEITLTCNPYYRYGGEKTAEELETLLLADTMRELISYAVGCMFGRYSLDKPGLILANQGDKIEQYFEQIPNPSFMPDKNNVIPILDDGWFSDDIVERFRKFIKVAFGEEQYESNMQFIEQALGKNDKPRDIRDYFLKDFYDDHVKRYKKRPIYWLFTSGNFSALIYMHRYQPDTVSIVLNDYLREFRTKLNAYKDQLNAINISASQSQSEKNKSTKEARYH